MRIENNIAFIENRLLHDAIWGDSKCNYCSGYVGAQTSLIGKAFIEYCISRIMGIHRLPKCGYDTYLYVVKGDPISYVNLDEKLVEDACKELEEVKNHVQEQLKKLSKVKDGKITVVRCLSKYQVEYASNQLHDNSVNEVEYPVSILSSYSYDNNTDENYPSGREDSKKHINIQEDVDIEDIILWDQYVGDGTSTCNYAKSMADEECELWVVDRSITGMKRLPRKCFFYSDGLPSSRTSYCRLQNDTFDFALYSNHNMQRACEYNWFTKLITKYYYNKLKTEK
jgi:hypothetical protein